VGKDYQIKSEETMKMLSALHSNRRHPGTLRTGINGTPTVEMDPVPVNSTLAQVMPFVMAAPGKANKIGEKPRNSK
jgi:aerobic-type carbon monoxide dehydrogenase small subunit (CoxS/CutS family)